MVDGKHKVISDPRRIRRLYIQGDFRSDALSVVPFELVCLAYGGFSLLPFLRVNRLATFPKILRMFSDKAIGIKTDIMWVRVKLFTVVGFFLIHIIACLFYLVSCYPVFDSATEVRHCFSEGWVVRFGVNVLTPETQYIRTLYYTVVSMTSVGFGDIVAMSDVECVVSIVSMIAGSVLFSFIMGMVATWLSNRDEKRTEYQKKVEAVMQYMDMHKLPTELREQIEDYYYHEWWNKKGVEFDHINRLPASFRAEIALEINRNILIKVPIFADCEDEVLRKLAVCMKTMSVLAHKVIIMKGQPSKEMFFIIRGKVLVVDDDGTVYAELGEGAFFGEVAMLFDMQRTANVVSASHCDLFVLTKEDLDRVVSGNAHVRERIEYLATQRLLWFKQQHYVDTTDEFKGNLQREMNMEVLRKVDLFKDCPDEALVLLADA
eukprot:Colp12_sorted_trinity150504_noHs@27810